ncbi:restriction endonuclease subunit S [Segatella copri]|uniref:restriction endonuclease subunit S n=1 Tax=Segatella copri TaxID=165179 RepID=UPI0022306514|nr:restriction endonuclease subunit S [Segatella copri]MCW4082550.1 restriction endonuclease subunit S [Segatella copri]
MEWKLKDLTVDGKGSYGIGAPAVPYQEDKLTYLRITDINDDGSLNFSDLKSVDAEDAEKYILKENDIVFARTGNSTGRSYFYEKQHGTFVYAGFLIKFSLDPNKVNPRILKYYTHSKPYFDWVNSFDTGATRGNINAKTYGDMEIELPSRKVQDKIVSILSSLDRKIELNNKINADLEEMAQAIFKNWFVDFEPFKDGKFVDSELGMIPEGWKVGRADDFYQINIGKTPPRKEHKWFSTNPADKIWVSIANMGNSGIFISDSSEYLTKEAVDRHNIIMVPRNTILLSFKLTVGRVAIADKELTTNEAIARFILSDDKYMEYLYLYLKKYDYNSLGSTSSIATAVNSKTIKGMQMLQPSDKIIDAFHIQVNPIFEKIRSLTKENSRLSLLRDTLLPRLMSGELEVPE